MSALEQLSHIYSYMWTFTISRYRGYSILVYNSANSTDLGRQQLQCYGNETNVVECLSDDFVCRGYSQYGRCTYTYTGTLSLYCGGNYSQLNVITCILNATSPYGVLYKTEHVLLECLHAYYLLTIELNVKKMKKTRSNIANTEQHANYITNTKQQFQRRNNM